MLSFLHAAVKAYISIDVARSVSSYKGVFWSGAGSESTPLPNELFRSAALEDLMGLGCIRI